MKTIFSFNEGKVLIMFKSEAGFQKTVVVLLLVITCILFYGLVRDIAEDFGRAAAYKELKNTQQY